MKTKKIKFFICILLLTFKSFSQLNKSYYDDDMAWQVSGVFAHATNSWSQKAYDKEVQLISIDLSFYKSNFELGGTQTSYRLKVVSDFIPQLASPLFEESRDQLFSNSGLPVLTSLLGWYNIGWGFVSTDKFQIAAGLHGGGYTYGIEVGTEDENNNIGDGYNLIAGGPALIADVLLPAGFELHYEGAYAFSYLLKDDEELEEDAKPAFLNQNLQLRRGRFFISYELVNGLHKTSNQITRSQFGLGIAF